MKIQGRSNVGAPVATQAKEKSEPTQASHPVPELPPRAGKVEVPAQRAFDLTESPLALGRMPKKGDALVQAVLTGLSGVVDAGDLRNRLTQLGFELALDQPDKGTRYQLGKLELDVRSFELADFPAFTLEFDGPKGFEASAGILSGVAVPKKQLEGIRDKYKSVLEQFERASDLSSAKRLPTNMDALKTFIEAGASKADREKEAEQDAEISQRLDALSTKFESLGKKAPKGVIVYVDGPDGAGKSSTGAIVMQSLSKAGLEIRAEAFKAPTKEERQNHWLARFSRGVPSSGEAVYWDRGPAGDAAYGSPTKTKLKDMAKDMAKFEATLEDKGVLLFKVELSADADKQAETFGKRLARRAIADRIEQKLTARGDLDEVKRNGLEMIRGKIDHDDVRALASFDEVQTKFMDFVDRSGTYTPWTVVDATKRHKARLQVIDALETRLDTWAKDHG